MTAQTVPGDWRSGAYGGNRRAHLFMWQSGGQKGAACGIRTDAKYVRRQSPFDPCPDCLEAMKASMQGEVAILDRTLR